MSLRSTRVARPRVGLMFWSRLGPLMESQISLGLATASSSERRRSAGSTTLGPERGLAQAQEPFGVPAPDVGGGGVDVDGEVEEVADRHAALPSAVSGRLQDVEALDDHDVGTLDDDRSSGMTSYSRWE